MASISSHMASWLDCSRASDITTMGIPASTAAWTRWPTLSEPVPYGMCFTSPCWLNRLSVNWVCSGRHHPRREGFLDEAEDRGEGLLRGERPAGHGMDVRPVHDGPDKGVLAGEHGDVTQGAEGSIVPPGLQTETNTEFLDLGSHVLQPGTDPVHQLGGRPLMGVAEVGADHRGTERPSQLHRVLEGGEALFCLVLLLDGEHGEVGSVHREPDVPLRRQFPETGAPPLLPWEPGDKGKLQRPVPPRHQVVEKRLVVGPLRRDPRNAEPDQRIVCHERIRMAGDGPEAPVAPSVPPPGEGGGGGRVMPPPALSHPLRSLRPRHSPHRGRQVRSRSTLRC